MQQIRHNRTRRAATARSHRNGVGISRRVFVTAAVMDKVPNDQEIGRIAHLSDHTQLILQPVLNLFFLFLSVILRQLRQQRAVPFGYFFFAKGAHIFIRVVMVLLRNGKLRQQ